MQDSFFLDTRLVGAYTYIRKRKIARLVPLDYRPHRAWNLVYRPHELACELVTVRVFAESKHWCNGAKPRCFYCPGPTIPEVLRQAVRQCTNSCTIQNKSLTVCDYTPRLCKPVSHWFPVDGKVLTWRSSSPTEQQRGDSLSPCSHLCRENLRCLDTWDSYHEPREYVALDQHLVENKFPYAMTTTKRLASLVFRDESRTDKGSQAHILTTEDTWKADTIRIS